MNSREPKGLPQPSDAEAGVWQGQSIARRFISPEGWVILVGRTATENDALTFKLASPKDFWLHVASESGSHVVVRNPAGLDRLPRETLRFAASLAAGYSKARHAGQVSVHVTRVANVRKPRGFPAGKVNLTHFESVRVAPFQQETD